LHILAFLGPYQISGAHGTIWTLHSYWSSSKCQSWSCWGCLC